MVEQVRSKGVPQRVRCGAVMPNLHGVAVRIQNICRVTPAPRGDEEVVAALALQDGGAGFGQVALQPVPRMPAQRARGALAPLAGDAQHAFLRLTLTVRSSTNSDTRRPEA